MASDLTKSLIAGSAVAAVIAGTALYPPSTPQAIFEGEFTFQSSNDGGQMTGTFRGVTSALVLSDASLPDLGTAPDATTGKDASSPPPLTDSGSGSLPDSGAATDSGS